ncbi:cysteine hydrolase [candidate division KSB1 bacterium]|nr:cysteine hydrolase [candidate division KSB1 bacterium]
MKNLPLNTALLIIDVQKAIDHPSWGQRNNPQMEKRLATLLRAWRQTQRPVIHVRHNSREPLSTYRPGQKGNEFKPEVLPTENEWIIEKQTNSAFIGTELEKRLRAAGIETLVVTGVITNNSVEATVRMAGNLGFETFVVADGTATFGRKDYNGVFRTAEEVHAMSLANMDQEYATIVTTEEVLTSIGYL